LSSGIFQSSASQEKLTKEEASQMQLM